MQTPAYYPPPATLPYGAPPPMPPLAKGLWVYKLVTAILSLATGLGATVVMLVWMAGLTRSASNEATGWAFFIVGLLFIALIPVMVLLTGSGVVGIVWAVTFKKRRRAHIVLHFVSTGLFVLTSGRLLTATFSSAITADYSYYTGGAAGVATVVIGLFFLLSLANCVLPALYYLRSPEMQAYLPPKAMPAAAWGTPLAAVPGPPQPYSTAPLPGPYYPAAPPVQPPEAPQQPQPPQPPPPQWPQ